MTELNKLPPAAWRLIRTSPSSGAWNMALDEALLHGMQTPGAQPVLRLYAWNPPCLSLGYAQNASDADQSRLAANGWELVRRPTGGRAILHTDELTYAVIAPPDEPRLRGGVLESYRRLASALLEALRRLNLPAEAQQNTAPHDRPNANGPVCFEVPSNYEITVGGKKLVGSAQARRQEGVLQHGSLPLHGDLTRITQALVYPDEASRQRAAERLLGRATTVEMVLGTPVSWEQAAAAFAGAFESRLNLQLEASDLTAAEREYTAKLVRERHAHPDWVLRL